MYTDQLLVGDVFKKALSVRDLKDKKTCILLKLYPNKQHYNYDTISLQLAHLERP